MSEKVWFIGTQECGELRGKALIVIRALYGLKSSGAAWRAMFASFVEKGLLFKPTRVDPDVYIKCNIKDDVTA